MFEPNFKEGPLKYKKGMTVTVKNNNISNAISSLKRRMNDEGITKELRDREYYMSKGQKRRKAHAAAVRRHKKDVEQKVKDGLI